MKPVTAGPISNSQTDGDRDERFTRANESLGYGAHAVVYISVSPRALSLVRAGANLGTTSSGRTRHSSLSTRALFALNMFSRSFNVLSPRLPICQLRISARIAWAALSLIAGLKVTNILPNDSSIFAAETCIQENRTVRAYVDHAIRHLCRRLFLSDQGVVPNHMLSSPRVSPLTVCWLPVVSAVNQLIISFKRHAHMAASTAIASGEFSQYFFHRDRQRVIPAVLGALQQNEDVLAQIAVAGNVAQATDRLITVLCVRIIEGF